MKKQFWQNPKVIFWTALILLIVPVSMINIVDPDLWWHMQRGRTMLADWAWPDFSKFYFTPVTGQVSTLRFTFLGDIILYLIHLGGGDPGLVLTRVLFVFLACMLLRSMAGNKIQTWHLLVLAVVVIGTYQKQLIRNSIFALVLFPLVIWILDQALHQGRKKLIWSLPLVLGIWSCLHGSYLLGFGVLALILAGEAADLIRDLGFRRAGKSLFAFAGVVLASFILISLWNPLTLKYYKFSSFFKSARQWTVLTDSTEMLPDSPPKSPAKPQKKAPSPEKEKQTSYPEQELSPGDMQKAWKEFQQSIPATTWGSIKQGLSNTIFKTANQAYVSDDFASPFNRLNQFYIKVCLAAGGIGVLLLSCFIRPFKFASVLPFSAVLVAGLGYQRLSGYIPLMTAALLFQAAARNELVFPGWLSQGWNRVRPWAIRGAVIVIMVGMWINLMLGFPLNYGREHDIFGLGRVPLYSEKLPDLVLSEYQNNKVFNSMRLGGYLLYRWFPRKRVFVDSFFAPHTDRVMFHDKLLRMDQVNPDFLHPEYGIDLALVDYATGNLFKSFSKSDNWYIRYMDLGMICFAYRPDFDADIPVPRLLFDQKELDGLPVFYREVAAKLIHTIPNDLFKKGRAKDAIAFENEYRQILDHTRKLVDPEFLASTRKLQEYGEQVYGGKNSKTLRYEYLHNVAVAAQNTKDALHYGEKVVDLLPDRYPVMMNLAIAYYKAGQWEESRAMLDRMVAQTGQEGQYFKKNKRDISKFYWALSFSAEKKGRDIDAYTLAKNAYTSDSSLISKEKLYQRGINLVGILNKSSQKYQALSVLHEMEALFSESGRWLNDIAWQIFLVADQGGLQLETAEDYARKAVLAMEEEGSAMLDLSYDTLAQILLKQDKTEQACICFQKAAEAAPKERKNNYQNQKACGQAG